MSDRAPALASLIDDLTADLPFSALGVEERLGVDLQRHESSNLFFTVFEGTCDGQQGLTAVEVREPTLVSLERGKNGLLLLRLNDGLDCDALSAELGGLDPAPLDPFAGVPANERILQSDQPWGRITATVNTDTNDVRVLMLDTSP